jgi:hypothetical protein
MSEQNGRVSGPMFWSAGSEEEGVRSVHGKRGGHYNTYAVRCDVAMKLLHDLFPEGEANDLNLCFFSTSGVHGTYTTIEEIEASLRKYGDDEIEDEELDKMGDPDDYAGNTLTFLVLMPRLVTTYHGQVVVTLDDIPFLKKLRASSRRAMVTIGGTSEGEE